MLRPHPHNPVTPTPLDSPPSGRGLPRLRKKVPEKFSRNASPKVFHAILIEIVTFLISSCRNASETKAWGLGTFTYKPDSLHRNFA